MGDQLGHAELDEGRGGHDRRDDVSGRRGQAGAQHERGDHRQHQRDEEVALGETHDPGRELQPETGERDDAHHDADGGAGERDRHRALSGVHEDGEGLARADARLHLEPARHDRRHKGPEAGEHRRAAVHQEIEQQRRPGDQVNVAA